MKALTVRQPWAGAIAHHGKAVENRSWHTGYRGPILIHAAKTAAPGMNLIEHTDVRSAIVAVAILVDCHPGDGRCTPWADHPEAAAWHWVLTDVRALSEPVACSGALGLWTPGPEIVAAVLADLDRPAPNTGRPDLNEVLTEIGFTPEQQAALKAGLASSEPYIGNTEQAFADFARILIERERDGGTS